VSEVLESIRALLDAGGFVMPPLLLVSIVLWYAIGWRTVVLSRGDRRPLRSLLRARIADNSARTRGVIDTAAARAATLVLDTPGDLKHQAEVLFGDLRAVLNRGSRLVGALVALAPLLGLLGTVTGMIETFSSLGDSALFARSGGIAGGVSQALVSTQMGLAVAVPGILLGRRLTRVQERMERELDELTHILMTREEIG